MKTISFIFVIVFLTINLYSSIVNVPADQPTIQDGITAAANTDTVLVQPGTYVENINYNGKNITVASLYLTTADASYISTTIIDGNSSGSVVIIENGEDNTAVLCGFTIINGDRFGGGGIFCNASNPTLKYLLITGNTAHQYGGGIWILNASPRLENLTITGNTAFDSGGGIYNCNSNTVITNSIVWNDSPDEIFFTSGSFVVTYSDIQNGWAGTGNINSEPLFVDSGSGDFHLQSTSPCIDTGDPVSLLDPDGTRADIGVFYYDQIIYPTPPIADFTVDITSGYFPLTVNFIDLSTSATSVIDEWYWDFGDGNNSSMQNPAYEYQLPGNYTVSLTVTDVNDSTDTETKLNYITVTNSGLIWHISTTGSDITGDGSEQYPFATIQHGIDEASNTDTVLVQPGTYMENIYFMGKLITVGSLFLTTADISYISTTIIDGFGSGSVVTFMHGEDSTAVLTGFTITNGSTSNGGGIQCSYSSSPSLQNLVIADNYADYGGGIYCEESSPHLLDVTISNNSGVLGGGIHSCNNSNPSFINSILWNNSSEEIYLYSSSTVTATYSDIEGGWTGTGNIDADPLFADPANRDYQITWANFSIPDATISPCIDAGDPASPFDPDSTIADMGALYFDKSQGVPKITDVTDVPNDQGRYVQVIWDKSPFDVPTSSVPIVSYSVWRYDDIFDNRGISEIYENPMEVIENVITDSENNFYWQRDDEILTFITQLPVMGYDQYSIISPTLQDSSIVAPNHSTFQVVAHTDYSYKYFTSHPDSGYSLDNIAPDETNVVITKNGSSMNLTWVEVANGSFQGNSYPEVNGIWYKIYAGDSPDFVCDETHLIETVTNLSYDYPVGGAEKQFFKIRVSDQP